MFEFIYAKGNIIFPEYLIYLIRVPGLISEFQYN